MIFPPKTIVFSEILTPIFIQKTVRKLVSDSLSCFRLGSQESGTVKSRKIFNRFLTERIDFFQFHRRSIVSSTSSLILTGVKAVWRISGVDLGRMRLREI